MGQTPFHRDITPILLFSLIKNIHKSWKSYRWILYFIRMNRLYCSSELIVTTHPPLSRKICYFYTSRNICGSFVFHCRNLFWFLEFLLKSLQIYCYHSKFPFEGYLNCDFFYTSTYVSTCTPQNLSAIFHSINIF